MRTLLRLFAGDAGKRLAVAGLAAATLIALVIFRTDRIAEHTGSNLAAEGWTEVTQLDAGYFVANVTRAPVGERMSAAHHTTHMGAAIAEFSRLIHYEGGEYFFDTAGQEVATDEMTRKLRLRFVAHDGGILGEFERNVPSEGPAGQSIQVWALAIPSGVLRSIEVTSDTLAVPWDEESDSRGCVTFTYGTDSSFASTTGSVFDFQSDRKTDR